MLQINISTQPIQLEYAIQNAQLNLQSTRATMQMETTPPTVEIHQPRGELTIDQTPCRYSIGLKNNSDFLRDNIEFCKKTYMETVARIVDEGNQMAQIENGSNAIANIAASSNYSEIPGITWAHVASPDIHYQASPIQFNPTASEVKLSVQPGTVRGDFQRGNFDIRVIQYPSINISIVDVKV